MIKMRKICQVIQSINLQNSRQQISRQISQKTCNNFVHSNVLFSLPCVFNRKTLQTIFCRSLSTINNKLNYSEEVSKNNNPKIKSNIIYYGSLTSSVKGIKVFTCISSLGGIVLQPILLQRVLNGENLAISLALCSTIGFFTFVTPLLIHIFTRKYITEISYNPKTDTYTATTLSFFLRRINMDFKVEDVSVAGALPIFSTATIKDKHVFFVSECFLDISHYARLMGYDKPLDLNIVSSFETNEKKFVEENQNNFSSKKI